MKKFVNLVLVLVVFGMVSFSSGCTKKDEPVQPTTEQVTPAPAPEITPAPEAVPAPEVTPAPETEQKN